jgi:hypothetical protein
MGRGRRWRAVAGLAEPQINGFLLDLLIALNLAPRRRVQRARGPGPRAAFRST